MGTIDIMGIFFSSQGPPEPALPHCSNYEGAQDDEET
jgi:hypothetical protein